MRQNEGLPWWVYRTGRFPLPLTPSRRNIEPNCIAQFKQTNNGRYEMKALTTLLVVGMFLTTVAMADDVDDVKAAVQGHFAALNAGDVNA